MIKLLFNIIILNLFCNINSQSICPGVFWWARDKSNKINGVLKIDNFDPGLKNVLTVRCTSLGDPQLGLLRDRDESTNDLINRESIYFSLNIQSQSKMPDIVDIVSNGKIICQNRKYIEYAPAGMKIINFNIGPITWSVADNSYHYSENELPNFVPSVTAAPTKPNLNRQTIKQKQQQQPGEYSEIDTRFDENPKLPPQNCGMPKKPIQLAKNGKLYSQESLPWLAILRNTQRDDFICAGSLISQKNVLSAAHCFDDSNNYRDYVVNLGVLEISQLNKEGNTVQKTVDNIVLHPNYNSGYKQSYYDIAIIILRGNVEFTARIIPICLWNSATDWNSVINKKGVVAGWGSNKELLAKVSTKANCESNPTFTEIISDTTFCAGIPNKTGACNGNAGSGLAFELNNKWYLGGIISRTISPMTPKNSFTCNLDQFIVYTDVSKLLNWIKSYNED